MNTTPPDYNLLRSLEALLVTGSVTRAARKLGIGQSAMSKQLEKLRQLTGDSVLVRQGRVVTLTERARRLVPLVGDAVLAVERALAPDADFDPAQDSGVLTLAMNDETTAPVLGRFMVRLAEVASRVDVRVRALGRDVVALLDSGQVDLAVLPDLRARAGFDMPELERFVVRAIASEPFVVVSRARRRLDRAAYLAASHVVTAPLGESDVTVLDASLTSLHARRRIALTVPTFTQAVLVVAQTELIATVPRAIAEYVAPALFQSKLPLPFRAPERLLVWHPRRTLDPRNLYLRSLLQQSLESLPRADLEGVARRGGALQAEHGRS
jgi:DNA-binding transcriptional LysR family regulator